MISALYIASWVAAISAGLGLGIYTGNIMWLLVCFTPFLWLVDWGKK